MSENAKLKAEIKKLQEKYERCEWAKGVVQSAASDALPWMQDGPIWKERAESAEQRLAKVEDFLMELTKRPSYIVNSSLCSVTEIAAARAACDNRWLCIDSIGFVRRDGEPD